MSGRGITLIVTTSTFGKHLSWPASSVSDEAAPRRIVCLISAKGKSKEQMKAEARQALQKYLDAQRPHEGD